MTAAMMRIMIPVASPPKYTPTSIAIFDVSGSLASCGSGAVVGLGCSACGFGVMVGCGSPTGIAGTTVGCNSSTRGSGTIVERGFIMGGSGIEGVGCGSSTCGSTVEVVGLGCGSGAQEGVHTRTMVAV